MKQETSITLKGDSGLEEKDENDDIRDDLRDLY